MITHRGQQKKTSPYTVLFETPAEYEEFKKVYAEIEKEYQADPFINMINDN